MSKAKVPAPAELLDRLIQEVFKVRYDWGNFRYLFADDDHRIDVMNATAPGFFNWVHRLAAESVFLGIARLVDPAFVSGRSNASLEQLMESTGWKTQDPPRWQRYCEELDLVRQACDRCRHYRHKKLGHLDLDVTMKVTAVPTVTVKDVDDGLDAIERFMGAVYRELNPNGEQLFRFINADEHVGQLLSRLTNRASRKQPDAVSSIVRTDDADRSVLVCAFCGERTPLYLEHDEMPAPAILRACHFYACHGVIGTEKITVEYPAADGSLRRESFDLGRRS